MLLGAGGAARAVRTALERAGADVLVAARRAEVATVDWSKRDVIARDVAIVVNATPIGMGDGGVPLDPAALGPGHVVVDLVYHPVETPLLAAARAAGARTVDGLGMLVHQAALQIERWAGRPAPIAVMREAAAQALR
jgi:shikimate dehydrogenase